MGNASSTIWAQTYKEIKEKHDAAHAIVQEGVSLDEQNKPEEALEKYKTGIQIIDDILRIQVTCPEEPESTWEKAIEMIQKMKKSRAEILTRINSLQDNGPCAMDIEEPPSYSEACSDESINPITYTDLANALSGIQIDANVEMEAELIYMYEGVKLYFISPNGEVSSTMRPQTMKIIMVESEGENVPRAILYIGDWVYPLIPGVSPCYRTEYGAFILPNVYAETPGSSIGLILPSDADKSVYEILESILYGIVGEAKPPVETSQKISNGIIYGASFLSNGLIAGAQKVGNLLNQGTPKLISRINSAERPTEIPAKVTRTMHMAENATNKAAQVTGYVAEQVGVATMKLGLFLAPHIQKQGTRILTTGFNMSEHNANERMKGVMTVAAGAVEGFSTVYRGLEDSASILGNSLKNNTVIVVQHKYGQRAGNFAGETLTTVGNVYQISKNAKLIKPTNLAKRTAKEAGKAIVHQYGSGMPNFPSTSNDVSPTCEKSIVSKSDLPKKE